MHDVNQLSNLHWHVQCVQCDWELHLVALSPYNVDGQPAAADDQIAGFWDDYCCPHHFSYHRQRVHINDNGTDLETAYLCYFGGQVTTTTVPTCDVCQQRLVGGQVLERLPFLLQPSLDVFAWVNAKLQQLMALYNSERHSNDAEYDPKQLQLLMAAELSMLQKFLEVLCKANHVRPLSVPFLWETPTHIDAWPAQLDEATTLLNRRQQQLLDRQQQEAHKQPATCPRCTFRTIYLTEAATV